MVTDQFDNIFNPNEFRELAEVPLWGCDIHFNLTEPDLYQAIINSVNLLNTNCFGYIVSSDDSSFYRISRYPRIKYGIPASDQALEILANTIAIQINSSVQFEQIPPKTFSVVIGLEEGYGTGIFHTLSEVNDILDTEVNLSKATILTARLANGKVITYTEPAVLIQTDDLNQVFKLAFTFKQERFAVEDHEKKVAYMVETPFCSRHD